MNSNEAWHVEMDFSTELWQFELNSTLNYNGKNI